MTTSRPVTQQPNDASLPPSFRSSAHKLIDEHCRATYRAITARVSILSRHLIVLERYVDDLLHSYYASVSIY